MNRADVQLLAKLRIEETKALFEQGHNSGAYYLAGYSIECALKPCIAKKTRRFEFPPKRKFVERVYSHDLTELL